MTRYGASGFSEGLLQLARANSGEAAVEPVPAQAGQPAAPMAAGSAGGAAASLEDIAACAALLARMATQSLRAGPSQKISAGHVTQLSQRLEAMLATAGFTERDRLWDCLVRPGSASPGRFLAATPGRP